MNQNTSGSRPGPNQSSPTRTLIITAITLFALSGLMVGFAFGAFTRPQQSQSPSSMTNKAPTATATQGTAPTPSPTPGMHPLGCPDVYTDQLLQMADGQTMYTAEVQAENKYENMTCDLEGRQQAVQNEGITCRLWLMKASSSDDPRELNDPRTLPEDRIKNKQLEEPFPDDKEIPGGLIFDPGTPQIQPCKQGKGTWTYALAPNIEEGKHYLMGLTSWDGQTYNWSWSEITIQKSGSTATPETEQQNSEQEDMEQEEQE